MNFKAIKNLYQQVSSLGINDYEKTLKLMHWLIKNSFSLLSRVVSWENGWNMTVHGDGAPLFVISCIECVRHCKS